MAKRWSDLSDRTRKLIVAAAVIEASLKAVALADLRRRPASQVRGSKWAWLPALLVNSAGIGPLAYWFFGRRRDTAS
jgi:Phospholipase_D-nuclease N-terminal